MILSRQGPFVGYCLIRANDLLVSTLENREPESKRARSGWSWELGYGRASAAIPWDLDRRPFLGISGATGSPAVNQRRPGYEIREGWLPRRDSNS